MNDGTTGLLLSPPLGDINMKLGGYANVGPVAGGTLERVLDRGYLRCTVRGGRPGFATYNSSSARWEGLDIAFCTALAASLFDGEADNVQFFDTDLTGTDNGFELLQDEVVDVFAGALWTLENTAREEATGQGYAFSQPYFYAPGNGTERQRFDENLCLATRKTDPQWSDFVFWAAQSLIYAEEHDIGQRLSSQMPLVEIFGPRVTRMFRDSVHAVGSYGEVYEQNLKDVLPRNGRNRLNKWDGQGRAPMRYLPPGFEVLDAQKRHSRANK